MSVLRDVLTRDAGKSRDEAHVDNSVLEVVHKASYDPDTKLLHMRGSDPDNQGAAYTINAPLETADGGDSRGKLIATSSALAASYTDGQLVGVSWSVDSAVSSRFSDQGAGILNQILFSDLRAANPVGVDIHDVDGFWFVPVRGSPEVELWNLKVFVPIGPGGVDRGADGDHNRKSEFILRFGDYDELASDSEFGLIVNYSSKRDSRYNEIFLQHPGTGWANATGRTDLKVKIFEHNVIGPAGPAGGASPPFGEDELTARVQGKLDGAVSGVERTSGSGLKVTKNDGSSSDVDVTPTRAQIVGRTGGAVTGIDDQGNFAGFDAGDNAFSGRLAFARTPISVQGSFMTPVDASAVTQTFAAADTNYDRSLGAFTGDDVSGYLEKSVVGGVGRITVKKPGSVSISLTEDVIVRSRSGTGEVEMVMVIEHKRGGSTLAQWTVEHNISDSISPSAPLEFPFTRTVGLLPVEAEDWFEVMLSFSATNSNSRLEYQLQNEYRGIPKAFAINFFGSVSGAVASTSHTDGQIKLLADAEIQRAFHPHGLTWDLTTRNFGGVLKWAAENLDADTAEKREAFRTALGIGSEEVSFLEDGADLNAISDSGIRPRLSRVALTNEPFVGPYILYTDAQTHSGGTFDLRQWAYSLSQPGLSAHRERLSAATRPTGITAQWRVTHSLDDLPDLDASVSSVEIQALEDAPERWVANPVQFGMNLSSDSTYLQGNVAAHGIGRIGTAAGAFSGVGLSSSNLSVLTANNGKLMLQVQDSATPGYRTPSTFYWRAANSPRAEYEHVPISVLLDRSRDNIFVSNAVLTTRQFAELTGSVEAYFEYYDIENQETVRVPGTLQPESLTLSKLRVPTSNGEINFPYSSPSQLRDGLQSLAGESRLDASAIKNIAASDTGADIVAKLQALAGAARLSASAIRDLPTPTAETAAQIVAKLEALQGANRLSAAAVKGLRSLVLESTADSAAKASLLDILGTAYSGTNKLTDSGDIFGAGAIKTAAIGDSQVTEGKLADAVSDRLLPETGAGDEDEGKIPSVDSSGNYHLISALEREGGDPVGTLIATSSAIPQANRAGGAGPAAVTWTLNSEMPNDADNTAPYSTADTSIIKRRGPPRIKPMIGFVAELFIGNDIQDRGFLPFGPGPASDNRGLIGTVALFRNENVSTANRVYFQQDVWASGVTVLSVQKDAANGVFPANTFVKIYEWVDTGSSISDESVIDDRIARFAWRNRPDDARRRQIAGIMDGAGTQAAADAMPEDQKLDYRFLKNTPDLILQGTKLPVEDRVPDNDVFNLEGDWEGYGPGLYRAVPTFLSSAARKSVSVRFNRAVASNVYTWVSESVSDQWRIPEITISTSLAQGNPNQSIEAYLWSEHADGIDSIQLTFGTSGGNALWPNDGLSQTLAKTATPKTIGGRTAIRYLWETPTAAGTPGSLAPDNVDISVSSDHDLRAARAWSLDFPREEILDKVNETPGAVHREVVADIDRPIVYDSLGDAQNAMFGSPHVLSTAAQNNRRTVRWLDSGRVREGVVKAEVPRGGSNGATTHRNQGVFTLVNGVYDSFGAIGSQQAYDNRIRSDPNHFVSRIELSVSIFGSPEPGGSATRLMYWQMDLSERYITSQQQNVNLGVTGLASYTNLQLRSVRRFRIGGQWYRRYATTETRLLDAHGETHLTIDFFHHQVGGSRGSAILYQTDSPYLTEGAGRVLPSEAATMLIQPLEPSQMARQSARWFHGTESATFSAWRGVGHDVWLHQGSPPAANNLPLLSDLRDDELLMAVVRIGSNSNCGTVSSRQFPAFILKTLPDLSSRAGGQTQQRVNDGEPDDGVASRYGLEIMSGDTIRTTNPNSIRINMQNEEFFWIGNWGGRLAIRTDHRERMTSDSIFDIYRSG